MTIQEACAAILAETKTQTWKEASPALQLLVIKSLIEQITVEPEDVAKPRKQRKPRKPKLAPLTQHAGGEDDVR